MKHRLKRFCDIDTSLAYNNLQKLRCKNIYCIGPGCFPAAILVRPRSNKELFVDLTLSQSYKTFFVVIFENIGGTID
jgi:hypothetical protein